MRGRPIKYEPWMAEKMEEELAKGFSIRACAPDIGVHRDTIYDWIEKYPDFSDSIKRGVDKGLKRLENRLLMLTSGVDIDGFDPKKCHLGGIIFILKTRFHEVYGDRQKVEQTVEVKGTQSFQVVPYQHNEDTTISEATSVLQSDNERSIT